MISRSFVVLEIVSLIAFAANGHTNPLFICQRRDTMESYTVTINQRDEIAVNNCTETVIEEIIGRIYRTNLRTWPIRLHMFPTNLNVSLANVTDLDLSQNDLSHVNLYKFDRLKTLNLTSNNIFSLRAIKLRQNITLTSLDLSRNRLLKLEHSSIPPTKRLSLRSNNIFEVEPNVTLPESLQALDLTRNEIENISSVSFHSKNLRVLNLSMNLINAVSRVTFEHLVALEILILECNKIYEIEEGTFSRNIKLNELNLRDNNLSVLKKGVFEYLANLQVLDISKNDLLTLTPDTVQNLNNLAVFSMSENLKLCDAECKHDLEFLLVLGGRLKDLKMGRLRLRKFPVMLTTSVRLLDLSENKLKQIQQGDLENFPFLESLTLSGNDIETTENDVFSRMEFLKVLRLENNKLKKVPAGLAQSLNVLHLQHNRILEIVKNDFYGLVNLKVLKINSNLIRSVESGAFRFLNNLETLDISNNPIVRLSNDAFEGPIKLKTLCASQLQNVGINVTDVRYFPISEMPNLRNLNLSRSPELSKSFFTDIPLLATVKQLEIADFSYAGLTRVPSHLQNFLPRLKSLVLLGNPLNCTDNWLQNWRQSYDLGIRNSAGNDVGLKIRVTREPTKPLYERNVVHSLCQFPIADVATTISKEEFWKSVAGTVNDNPPMTDAPSESRYENFTFITLNNKFRLHGYELTRFKNLFRYDVTRPEFGDSVNRDKTLDKIFISTESTTIVSSVRNVKSTNKGKKLNSRSLHVAKFSNNKDHLSLPINSTNSTSSTEMLEILHVSPPPLFDSSHYSSKRAQATTVNSENTSKVLMFPTDNGKMYSSNVTSIIEIHSQTVRPEANDALTYNLTASVTSPPFRATNDADEEIKNATNFTTSNRDDSQNTVTLHPPLQRSSLISKIKMLPLISLYAKVRLNSDVNAIFTKNLSTIPTQNSPIVAPSGEADITTFRPRAKSSQDGFHITSHSKWQNTHHESLMWNRTNDHTSFFDWFPSVNESANLAERAAALDDNTVEYTHPGLVLFSAITCFLIVVFLSLVVPPCIQKYKWRRQRYKASEFDNECQTSIEISSVSAFIETEISLE